MQLSASPIQVILQDFVELCFKANSGEEHGLGCINVEREFQVSKEEENRWIIFLTVEVQESEGELPPPYTGKIVARGIYKIHDEYQGDPEKLIRVTGVSILYGAAREMCSQITARGPNGILTLPSVSFFEEAPTAEEKE